MPNLSRETKFSGANTDREIFIFPVQLTACRIGNLTRLIHTHSCYICYHTIPLVLVVNLPSSTGMYLVRFSDFGAINDLNQRRKPSYPILEEKACRRSIEHWGRP